MRKHFVCFVLAMTFICAGARAQQKRQAPSRPAPSRILSRAQAPIQSLRINPGVFKGYVFWSTNAVQYSHAAPCMGLVVTVQVIANGGAQPIGTDNNLTSMGNVGTYAVCAYAVLHVPEGQPLGASVRVPPAAFVPQVASSMPPADAKKGFIKIPGGACLNKLSSVVPSASDLLAAWWVCGDDAYNVNFALYPPNLPGLKPPGLQPSGTPLLSGGVSGSASGNNGLLARSRRNGTLIGGLNPAMNASAGKAPETAREIRNPVEVKFAPPKALRKVANPALAQQDAALIGLLRQQRQLADQEATQMKLTPGSATASSSNSIASRSRTAAPDVRLQSNTQALQLGTERTQSENGTSDFQISNKHYAEPPVVACGKNPTPRILYAPTVFTPEAKYNSYWIGGCGFGPSASGNSAYIFGANGFRQYLTIDFWSDHDITAHLNPALAGVLDQKIITLVVAPSGRQETESSGHRFYAARGMPGADGSPQEVQLMSVPESNVALSSTGTPLLAAYGHLPLNAPIRSFSAFDGTPVAGWTFRYASGHADKIAVATKGNCYMNDVPYVDPLCRDFALDGVGVGISGLPPELKRWDVWDFSKLAPGFAISSYELYYLDTDPGQLCSAWDQSNRVAKQLGSWDFTLGPDNRIVVGWALGYCGDIEWSGRHNIATESSYGLAVWVMGPRCVDAWTGQRDQNCVNQIQQMLGQARR
jgi:hypothetical protein